MGGERVHLPQGTLGLLILRALALEPQHAWPFRSAFSRARRTSSRCPKAPSICQALHRLEPRGWITVAWGISDDDRQAKYYSLSRTGRTRLEAEADNWRRLTAAVGPVMDMK